jgi:hypothetical protein
VLAVLELDAKLNRELGPGSEDRHAPAVLILGDVDVDRYRRAADRPPESDG